eukprot:TRINITY_DN50834_c0_g1_i1.p1 TRINITY_DN50834_c0_g1~~TRINITY_DN50834_c0_g1_i1.p1  ORF type:complete len:417 (+),score=76.78 TRINITY_DN50834_c0_g1_i1:55-1251(+)
MARVNVGFFVVWLLGAPQARAWWDEAHLLTAAVAKRYLEHTDQFNAILKTARSDFANFSDVVTAAVWLDHMKCTDKQVAEGMPFCKGLSNPASFKMLDEWHFVNLPFNPDNMTLKRADTLMPFYEKASYFIADAVGALSDVGKTLGSGTKSTWTWNLMLRMILHILGDLHQPLHVSTLYSATFPGSDMGGNLIQLQGPSLPATNLHALWDAAGGMWTTSWPVSSSVLDAEVQRITGEHSPESFIQQGRLAQDWQNSSSSYGILSYKKFLEGIANDTGKFAHEVYGEYLEQSAKGDPKTYHPSDAYLARVKEISEAQVALGGYRLASWLNELSSHLPVAPSSSEPAPPPPESSEPGWGVVAIAGVVGVVIGAVLTAAGFKVCQRQRHVRDEQVQQLASA